MHYVQTLYSEHRPPVVTFAYNTFDYFVNYLLSWRSPRRELVVAVGTHIGQQDGPCILYNTEQMTCAQHVAHILERLRCGDIVQVWDYSEYNAEALRAALAQSEDEVLRSITVSHVPLQVCGPHLCRLKALHAPFADASLKTYDVGFCGTPSPRREAMLEFIKSQGIAVHRVAVFGEQRDRELCRCKIILNIHYSDDYRVFESLRCEPWLRIGVPVVSEESVDNDRRCVVTAYHDLPRVISKLLQETNT